MINKGAWVHENFMDIFVDVIRVQYRGPKYVLCRIMWCNKGYMGTPWIIDGPRTIKIMNEDMNKWRKVPPSWLGL